MWVYTALPLPGPGHRHFPPRDQPPPWASCSLLYPPPPHSVPTCSQREPLNTCLKFCPSSVQNPSMAPSAPLINPRSLQRPAILSPRSLHSSHTGLLDDPQGLCTSCSHCPEPSISRQWCGSIPHLLRSLLVGTFSGDLPALPIKN